MIGLIKMIYRRLFPRRYGNIVAPLSHISDELLALQQQNDEDNRLDTLVIQRIEERITHRSSENEQASATRSKILSLLSH